MTLWFLSTCTIAVIKVQLHAHTHVGADIHALVSTWYILQISTTCTHILHWLVVYGSLDFLLHC